MFSASTSSASPTTLTVRAARELAADAPAGATYYRAYENGEEVDRGHTSGSRRLWDMESTGTATSCRTATMARGLTAAMGTSSRGRPMPRVRSRS